MKNFMQFTPLSHIARWGMMAIMLLVSCRKEDTPPVYEQASAAEFYYGLMGATFWMSPSYIQGLNIVKGVRLDLAHCDGFLYCAFSAHEIITPQYIATPPEGPPYAHVEIRPNPRLDSLCAALGDTHFNERMPFGIVTVVADRFTSVDLTSDRPFDKRHPAGSSLGDIVRLWGASAAAFIESGYQIPKVIQGTWESMAPYRRRGVYCSPINKRLCNLRASDLRLMEDEFCLKFEIPPPAGKHNFTITFRSAQKVITSTFEVNIQ